MYIKAILILISTLFYFSCEKNLTNSDNISDEDVIQFIIEADKKKIKTPGELKNVLNIALKNSAKKNLYK